MTGVDLLNYIRSLLDDTLDPVKWTDEDLCLFIDETLYDMATKLPLFLDSESSMTQIVLQDDVAVYGIDPRIFRIISATIGSRSLNIIEYNKFEKSYPSWKVSTGSFPSSLIVGYNLYSIILYPRPIQQYINIYGDTVNLRVQRFPLQTAFGNPSFYAEEFELKDPLLLKCLVNGVLARAYKKDDTETYSLERSSMFDRLYFDSIEDLKIRMLKSTKRDSINILPQGFL